MQSTMKQVSRGRFRQLAQFPEMSHYVVGTMVMVDPQRVSSVIRRVVSAARRVGNNSRRSRGGRIVSRVRVFG